jgi:hypothetical protein
MVSSLTGRRYPPTLSRHHPLHRVSGTLGPRLGWTLDKTFGLTTQHQGLRAPPTLRAATLASHQALLAVFVPKFQRSLVPARRRRECRGFHVFFDCCAFGGWSCSVKSHRSYSQRKQSKNLEEAQLHAIRAPIFANTICAMMITRENFVKQKTTLKDS